MDFVKIEVLILPDNSAHFVIKIQGSDEVIEFKAAYSEHALEWVQILQQHREVS